MYVNCLVPAILSSALLSTDSLFTFVKDPEDYIIFALYILSNLFYRFLLFYLILYFFYFYNIFDFILYYILSFKIKKLVKRLVSMFVKLVNLLLLF